MNIDTVTTPTLTADSPTLDPLPPGHHWVRHYDKPCQFPRAMCGHKYRHEDEPRTNCQVCWFTWFNQHGDLVQTCDMMFTQHGIETLTMMRGKRFAKMFLRFMGTLALWKEQEKEASEEQQNTETHVQSITGASGVDSIGPTGSSESNEGADQLRGEAESTERAGESQPTDSAA